MEERSDKRHVYVKKVKTLPDDAESASAFKVDYGRAARTALQINQQGLATKEVEQWMRSELENTELRVTLVIPEKTAKEKDNQKPKTRDRKMNVSSGKVFGMTRVGTKILSIISVTGYQAVKNLTETSEITLVHLVIYADYLGEKKPKLDSRAVKADCPQLMGVDGHHIEVYDPHPILIVDGINIYTKAHVTNASDQVGWIYIGREELKVRRIGNNAMLEQDVVHM